MIADNTMNITKGVEFNTGKKLDGKIIYGQYFSIPDTSISSTTSTVINFDTKATNSVPLLMYATFLTKTSGYYFTILSDTSISSPSANVFVRYYGNRYLQLITRKDFAAEVEILSGTAYIEYTK